MRRAAPLATPSLNHLSCALATCSDIALGVLGGDLKRRELLYARLGDVHSELFIACSILKYHDTSPRSEDATTHAEFALGQSLHKAQQARPWLGGLLRVICLPPWSAIPTPDDQQIRTLGELIMEPNAVREALAKMVFVSDDPEDAVGRVESTYQMLLALDKPWQAVMRARSKGELDADSMESALREAAQKEIITEDDIAPLLEYDARRYDCLLTDHALQGV
ncbi:MAG: acyl-CoA dehydrogenase [Halioglobus sp.]|jgi:acyl-CoA dehydrogenase